MLSRGKKTGFSLSNSAWIMIEALSCFVKSEADVTSNATSLIPKAGLSVKCSATFPDKAFKSRTGTEPDINGGFMLSDVTLPPVSIISWRKAAGTDFFPFWLLDSAGVKSKLE